MKLSSQKILEAIILNNGEELPPDFFDDQELEELKELSKQEIVAKSTGAKRPVVYILPGILGSTLWRDRQILPDDWIWLSLLDLASGGIEKLKYSGKPNKIYARDAFEIYYLKLKLSLRAANFDAEYLPYDWRFSPNELGTRLFKEIQKRNEKNISLVCHSMGGLVARQMASLDPDRKHISQVITLGTPNYGSFSPVEVFDLKSPTTRYLAMIDIKHTEKEIVGDYIRNFPGLVEMMPDPKLRNEDYYAPETWPSSALAPDKKTLKKAKTAKKTLSAVDDRFIQIIGMNQQTIQSAELKNGKFVYGRSNEGDGTVPLDLARMGKVDQYYTDTKHAHLPRTSTVISAVIDILKTGKTKKLRTSPFRKSDGPAAMVMLSGKQLKKEQKLISRSKMKKLIKNALEERLVA